MNKAQEYIVQILNHSIHNKKIELDTNKRYLMERYIRRVQEP